MRILSVILLMCAALVYAQWSSDPGTNLMVSGGIEESLSPMISLGISGDSYVSWVDCNDTGEMEMRLQRLDLLGNPQWGAGGILVRDDISEGEVFLYDITTDASGAAILSFTVEEYPSYQVYAYRISEDGNQLWGSDGILLSDSTEAPVATFGNAVSTPSGDVVVSWSMISEPDTAWTVMQRISPDGTLQWGDGVTVGADSAGLYCWEATLCPTGSEDVILVYTLSHHDAFYKRLYAMKWDEDGDAVWASPAVVSNSTDVLQQCIQPPSYADGSGGLFITWTEFDAYGFITSLVQHVNGDGSLGMNAGGASASTKADMNKADPMLAVSDDHQSLFVFWCELNELQDQNALVGQMMDVSGNRLWSDSGITYVPLQNAPLGYIKVRTAGDSAAVFYLEAQDSTDAAFGMLLDDTGAYLWPGDVIDVSSASCSRSHFSVSPFCWGQQWITVWDDDRGSVQAVYAQNVKLDGTLGTSGLGLGQGSAPGPAVLLDPVTPNPFSSSASVSFTVGSPGRVEIDLYDLSGRAVRRIADDYFGGGSHSVEVRAGDVPSGVYLIRLETSGSMVTRRCIIMR